MRSSSSCLARMTVSGGASYSRRRCARREAEATVGVATIEVRALVSSVGGAPKRAGLVPGRRPAEFDAVARSAGRCAASPFGTLDASSARFPKTPFSTLRAASSVCRRSRQPREELAGNCEEDSHLRIPRRHRQSRPSCSTPLAADRLPLKLPRRVAPLRVAAVGTWQSWAGGS